MGIFGGIRGYLQEDKKSISIFRLQDHYHRFLKSLKIINKSIPYSHKELVDITIKLAKKNNPKTDTYIRPFAYADSLDVSPNFVHCGFNFALYMIPMGEYLPIHKGLNLSISSWTRITDNVIPARAKISGGYVNSALAKSDATAQGFDDTLMMSQDGHIAEASAANFFLVRDNHLITPPRYQDVLEGITRRTIFELAKGLNIPVLEHPIDRTEVYIADEAFLSGTGVQVAWISQVDNRKIGDGKIGPISQKIQNLFFNIVRAKVEKYKHWLTKI